MTSDETDSTLQVTVSIKTVRKFQIWHRDSDGKLRIRLWPFRWMARTHVVDNLGNTWVDIAVECPSRRQATETANELADVVVRGFMERFTEDNGFKVTDLRESVVQT